MSSLVLKNFSQRTRELAPGFVVSSVVAAAACFLSEHYGAPVMLFALLLGMSVNFLAAESKCKVGIEFTARSVLRMGIALLGMRITLGQITALGWQPVALVVTLVIVTIAVSVIAAKILGFQKLFGMLTGGSTAICGASAALALSAAFPNHPQKEKGDFVYRDWRVGTFNLCNDRLSDDCEVVRVIATSGWCVSWCYDSRCGASGRRWL